MTFFKNSKQMHNFFFEIIKPAVYDNRIIMHYNNVSIVHISIIRTDRRKKCF